MKLSDLNRKAATQLIARRQARLNGASRPAIKAAGVYAKKMLNNGTSAASAIEAAVKLIRNQTLAV